MIKAAIIGYGQSGKLSHAYGMQASGAFEIVAICDTLPANRESAVADLGCRAYEDYLEMLRLEDLDLVAVVTRSDTHAAIACACLASGKHVLVTKPWALNEKEALTMIEAQDAAKRKIFPWIPAYWSPDFRCIQQLLKTNPIGDIFLIRRYVSDFRFRKDWQTESRFGGGYLLNWGMHIVQPVLGLAKSKVVRVFGQMQQVINPGDVEDNFLAVLEFENGIRGVAEFTESAHSFPGFVIQGTSGTIVSDTREVTVLKADPTLPGEVEKTTYPLEGKLYGEEKDIYQDVAAHLVDGKPFPTPPALALEGTRILDAIRRSHEKRQTISL